MILTSASQLSYTPKRIISLVPSQTELLYSLGLEKETVGITKFCIRPDKWFRNKIRVGGTKNIDIQKITELQPDLIIANKEENAREQVEALADVFPVWITDVKTLDDSFKMINDIGLITSKTDTSSQIIVNIKSGFSRLQTAEAIPTAYLIWKGPWMTIGNDTFIHDVMSRGGFENVFAQRTRYPEISIAEIKRSHTKLLMLSSEPYPFGEKHVQELGQQLPGVQIILVDGELFSWYGSRLLHTAKYLKELRELVVSASNKW